LGGHGNSDEIDLSSAEQYEQIILDAMRYLNLSLNEAEKLTLRDFSYQMHVTAIKKVDAEHDMALSAWYNGIVRGKDKHGKPTYKEFKQLFDYDKRIKELTKKPNKIQDTTLKTLLLQANK